MFWSLLPNEPRWAPNHTMYPLVDLHAPTSPAHSMPVSAMMCRERICCEGGPGCNRRYRCTHFSRTSWPYVGLATGRATGLAATATSALYGEKYFSRATTNPTSAHAQRFQLPEGRKSSLRSSSYPSAFQVISGSHWSCQYTSVQPNLPPRVLCKGPLPERTCRGNLAHQALRRDEVWSPREEVLPRISMRKCVRNKSVPNLVPLAVITHRVLIHLLSVSSSTAPY